MARVQRTDISALRPVERREDGTILADAHLTRTGVFDYHQADGSLRRELRLPEDVFDAASLKSFEGRPITNDHPPGMIDAQNARQFTVGALTGTVTQDGDHSRGRLSVYDADTVKAMNSGKIQVSCGYTCDTIEKPGEHPIYGKYDAIQKNIRGNHVAIVDRGRAGQTAAVRMDGWQVSRGDDFNEGEHPRDEHGRFGAAESKAAEKSTSKASAASANAAKEESRAGKSEGHRMAAAEAHTAAAQAHLTAVDKHISAREVFAQKGTSTSGIPGDVSAKTVAQSHENIASAHARAAADHFASAAELGSDHVSEEMHYGKAGTGGAVRHINWKGDSVDIQPGTKDAVDGQPSICKTHAMKTPRLDETIDPDDEADRNARGENNAKPTKKLPAPEIKDDDDDDTSPNGEVDMDADDAPPASPYHDENGKLTPEAAKKIAASTFARPDKKQLPIHDPKAVKSSMKAFGKTEFDDADEKHAAFNRISGKAEQFGMDPAPFQAKHAGKLDRLDGLDKDEDIMTAAEIKALQDKADKADKRADKLVTARARIDQLDGQVASLERDLAAAKTAAPAAPVAKTDASDDVQARVDAKIDLLDRARRTGAKVDAKMSDTDIKLAVIKHVDKEDVPADKAKLPPYVDAMFDGACKRAKTDADKTEAGASALGAARILIAPPGAHADAAEVDDTDEEAAATRLRSDTASAHQRKETK